MAGGWVDNDQKVKLFSPTFFGGFQQKLFPQGATSPPLLSLQRHHLVRHTVQGAVLQVWQSRRCMGTDKENCGKHKNFWRCHPFKLSLSLSLANRRRHSCWWWPCQGVGRRMCGGLPSGSEAGTGTVLWVCVVWPTLVRVAAPSSRTCLSLPLTTNWTLLNDLTTLNYLYMNCISASWLKKRICHYFGSFWKGHSIKLFHYH